MKRKALSLISIMALLFASAGLSFAQTDAPAEDAPAKADQPQVIEKSLMDMWNAGGWTMYPLGLFAIFGTTLIIYNAISIRQKKFLNPTGVKEVEKLVGQLQIAEAIEYCEKNPSPITNIIGSGLARADIREIDVQAVESAMEEASVEEFATPYVFINYLSVIASLAPMMGLYGTVSGMVKAFNTIAAEGAGSASKLADNISEALITTATGMIVGIPAMFFFFLFKQSYGKIISSSSRIIGDIVYTMKVAIKYGPQEVEAEEEAPAEEAPVEEAPAETQE
jgi:biopolymer transport protein ExbB